MKMKMKNLKRKWLVFSGIGLGLFGMGICFVAEAAYLKHNGADVFTWISLGTVSLIVTNSGLAIFGQAIIYKMKMDL
jgi:hypothetical protein